MDDDFEVISTDDPLYKKYTQANQQQSADPDIEPLSEQDALGYATRQADIKYAQDAPGKIEAGLRGFQQGGTLGFIDELAPSVIARVTGQNPDMIKQRMRQRTQRAQDEQPGAFMTGDLFGSVASSALPGMGIAKGAKLGTATGKMLGLGAVEGYGRTEESDAKGITKDVALNALLAGAAPAGFKGTQEALKKAKGLLPGTTQSPRILNKAVAQGSRVTGASGDTARVYEEILNNPEKMQSAMRPEVEKVDEIPIVNQKISDAFNKINETVSKRYADTQAAAFSKNVQNMGDFQNALSSARQKIDDVLERAARYPKTLQPRTLDTLETAKGILGLDDFDVGNIGEKLNDIAVRAQSAGGNPKILPALEKEKRQVLHDLGGAITRAKRDIDSDIKWAKKKDRSRDQRVLKDVRNQLNELTHEVTGGATEMKRADAFYSDYAKKAEPFFEQFTGRGPDGLSSKKIGDFITESGSPYKQAEIRAYEKAARNFFNEHNIDTKEIDTAVGQLNHWKDQAAISKLGGQTGQQTGRSVYPISIGATVGLASNPVLGAAMALLASPSMSPTMYLRALQGTRDVIKKMGESEAAKIFGESWPAIKTALSRQIANDQDVKEMAKIFAPFVGVADAQTLNKEDSRNFPTTEEIPNSGKSKPEGAGVINHKVKENLLRKKANSS